MPFTQRQLDALAKRYTDAWNSKIPTQVADMHVPGSSITINRGEPSVGHTGLTEMAAGFHSDVPDLHLTCDGIRGAGTHVVYMWTFTGHHAETGNPLNVTGWEEWELNDDMKVTSSLGWFDAEDYDRQVAG
ncbi:nuclear transport factor 2 family protein [uncultured Roseobacter sp.]|uniref:nuclear transport factor 2 family protein n=1 Tax=uncultured Roseobacter sp. TaxID=114847 RepID=UPI00261448ED|nr:nuclear transport factor 2 family protein [uncultured Roseobacter sp.]